MVGSQTKIEWADSSWSVISGCTPCSPGCANCLAPNTLVLMANMTWKRIVEIEVGDEVVGFTEHPGIGQNRTYELATVQHVWTTRTEAVEIEIGGRKIIASADHRFLIRRRPYWRKAKHVTLQTNLVDIGIESWVANICSEAYLAGYAGGVITVDGTMRVSESCKDRTLQSYMRVALLASDRCILERFSSALNMIGCRDIYIRPFDPGKPTGKYIPKSGVSKQLIKVETRRHDNLIRIAEKCLIECDNIEWKAGWLAGFFDTDGCYSANNLRFSQSKANGALDKTTRYITDLGFSSTRESFDGRSAENVRVTGRVEDKTRFLSVIQPALARKVHNLFGRRMAQTTSHINGVREIGKCDLVDLQTTSGTFIADGIATHNCYARRMLARHLPEMKHDADPGTLVFHPDRLDIPLHWRKPRWIFVCSMSDLFHEDVPDEWRDEVWTRMWDSAKHTYLILTKRPVIMAEYVRRWDVGAHIWLGVTVCNQAEADEKIPILLQTPAALRFVSVEPMLAPVDLRRGIYGMPDGRLHGTSLEGIDQILVGAESGPGARPMDEDWVRSLRDQAVAAGVAFFYKQRMDNGHKISIPTLDGRTWTQIPP